MSDDYRQLEDDDTVSLLHQPRGATSRSNQYEMTNTALPMAHQPQPPSGNVSGNVSNPNPTSNGLPPSDAPVLGYGEDVAAHFHEDRFEVEYSMEHRKETFRNIVIVAALIFFSSLVAIFLIPLAFALLYGLSAVSLLGALFFFLYYRQYRVRFTFRFGTGEIEIERKFLHRKLQYQCFVSARCVYSARVLYSQRTVKKWVEVAEPKAPMDEYDRRIVLCCEPPIAVRGDVVLLQMLQWTSPNYITVCPVGETNAMLRGVLLEDINMVLSDMHNLVP
jgi:hypothetical protein